MSIFCKHDYNIYVDLDSCEYRSLVTASVWQQCKKCEDRKMATTEFTGTEGCAVKATVGAINEIKAKSNDRLDFARGISQRIQDLRIRLVSHVPECNETTCDTVEAPKAEVEQLAETISVMNTVLIEIDENLSMLERL